MDTYNLEDLIAEKAEDVPEGNQIEIDFFNVKKLSTECINSCQGDLFIICNVLCDYCDILERKLKEEDYIGLKKANYEYYINRCRNIYNKLAKQLNYDRDKALEKCIKNRNKAEDKSDIGEDALVLMARGKRGL